MQSKKKEKKPKNQKLSKAIKKNHKIGKNPKQFKGRRKEAKK